MRMSCRRDIWMRGSAISATALVVFALGASSALARDISQSGEQKNMRRVGHSDLQGRAAYHPDFIRYPDGRVIAFVGTHSNTTDNGPRPNPLQPGSPVEPNGTMIVDITNPSKAVDKFHIPGPIPTGAAQTQSNRICLGSDLPGGTPGQRLHDAQRSGGESRRLRLRGLGRHERHQPHAWWERCATFATRTSIGGSARPVSLTCRAAKARRRRNGARGSR